MSAATRTKPLTATAGAALAAIAVLLASGCARPGTATAVTSVGSPHLSQASPVPLPVRTSARSSAPPSTPSSAPSSTPAPSPAAPSSVASSMAPAIPGCSPEDLATVEPGTLTMATGPQRSAPWFSGDGPADGTGFEAAVAAAVAARLGYPPGTVRWIELDPGTVQSGSATGYDAYLGRLTVPDDPSASKAVDWTTGYLENRTVVLASEGSAAAGLRSMSGLRKLQVGALPGADAGDLKVASRFATAGAAATAVDGSSVDAVIAPLAVASGRVPGGLEPVALVPEEPGWQSRQFGMATPAGSPVTACLSTAIDLLRVEGGLDALAQRWLPVTALPELVDR